MDISNITIQPPVKVAQWIGDARTGYLRLLDQTLLPLRTQYMDCHDAATVYDAISRLVVRGAPAIGVAAGYGMVVAAQSIPDGPDFLTRLEDAAKYLESSRPTAVNLSWATRQVLAAAKRVAAVPAARQAGVSPARPSLDVMLAKAREIESQDAAMCLEIGKYAAPLIMTCAGDLTHCNAGALATAGIGTATAGMYVAHALGHKFSVYCDETRPLLQGARLTAWELVHAGICAVLITDNMAAQVMREGKVQLAIVGADRIAANGDTANKIGTYGVAIFAHRHGIPFYVAAPYSTFDLTIATGRQIPIEQRKGHEITNAFGQQTSHPQVQTYNPAFDVTPAELITGIITERGIISPVTTANIAAMIK